MLKETRGEWKSLSVDCQKCLTTMAFHAGVQEATLPNFDCSPFTANSPAALRDVLRQRMIVSRTRPFDLFRLMLARAGVQYKLRMPELGAALRSLGLTANANGSGGSGGSGSGGSGSGGGGGIGDGNGSSCSGSGGSGGSIGIDKVVRRTFFKLTPGTDAISVDTFLNWANGVPQVGQTRTSPC